jgi:hypothetical protein
MQYNSLVSGCRSHGCEECCLLGCDAVYFGEIPKFRRNVSPLISWYKNKASKKQASFAACFCWFLSWLVLRSKRWRRYDPPKRLDLSELHDVTALFILTTFFIEDVDLTLMSTAVRWHKWGETFPALRLSITDSGKCSSARASRASGGSVIYYFYVCIMVYITVALNYIAWK